MFNTNFDHLIADTGLPSLNRKQGNSAFSLFPLLSISILKISVCATA